MNPTPEGVKFWLDIITDGAVIVGAPIAVFTILVQVRGSRFSANFDNLWKLDAQWQTPDLRKARVAVANALLQKGKGTLNSLDLVGEQVRDVVDFFDMVGLLVHKHAVDLEVAWNDFAEWAIGYWAPLNDWLKVNRHGDNTLWNQYETLYGRLVTVEARKRSLTESGVKDFYKANLSDFLKRESQLSTT